MKADSFFLPYQRAWIEDKSRIRGLDISLKEGEIFHIGSSQCQIISVDGHTIGHILYYFADSKALFTGDTLFNLCIGGIFEGTPADMRQSLQKIRALPDDVMFYPGHEYTWHSLRSLISGKADEDMKKYYELAVSRLQEHKPVAPVSLELEKKCNPYLRDLQV